jgi:hypothetical protein
MIMVGTSNARYRPYRSSGKAGEGSVEVFSSSDSGYPESLECRPADGKRCGIGPGADVRSLALDDLAEFGIPFTTQEVVTNVETPLRQQSLNYGPRRSNVGAVGRYETVDVIAGHKVPTAIAKIKVIGRDDRSLFVVLGYRSLDPTEKLDGYLCVRLVSCHHHDLPSLR